MGIIIGVVIFLVGCCVSSYEDNSYQAQRNADIRQKEIITQLAKLHERELTPKEERRTRRRIAQDKEGNLLAEEITEEIIR